MLWSKQSCVPGPGVHCFSERSLSGRLPPSKEGEHQHLTPPVTCSWSPRDTSSSLHHVSRALSELRCLMLMLSSAFPSSESLLLGFYSTSSPSRPFLGPSHLNKVTWQCSQSQVLTQNITPSSQRASERAVRTLNLH